MNANPETALAEALLDNLPAIHRWFTVGWKETQPEEAPRLAARILAALQASGWSLARAGERDLDASLLGMALDLVDEEDARLGVVGRGRKVDRVVAVYARLQRPRTAAGPEAASVSAPGGNEAGRAGEPSPRAFWPVSHEEGE